MITRDAEEVSLAKILEYVSPAELERFENQDFFDEDERERLLPPKKPRGRPRRDDRIVPSFNTAPISQQTSREHSLLPDGSLLIKKKIGRPKGTFRKKADKLTSTKLSIRSQQLNTITRGRGRPPRQNNISVVIPSFNGPQPQELESSPDPRSEGSEILDNPKPQYSMITASGLGQSETEDMTSRDQSVELVPSSKKRRLDTENAFIDLDPSDNDDETLSNPTKRAKTYSEASPDPIADDSIALLRQFQARVYGPDPSEKNNAIAHPQSKPNPTIDDSHSRPSRPGSSSSDSLMGPIPRSLKPLPSQNVPSKPRPQVASSSQHSPRAIPTRIPAAYLHNSITAPHPLERHPAKTTPTKPTPPPKSIARKVSLTPHFPPSTSFSHGKSKHSARKRTPYPPSRPSQPAFSPSSRTATSPPRKKIPSPTPRTPSQSSQASTTSRIGFAGLPPATHITDYFAPKPAIANPPPSNPHQSLSELLGLGDSENNDDSASDSDSEDHLARNPSTDSIRSEPLVVRPKRPPPTNQPATATPQQPSTPHDPIDIGSSEDDSSDDEPQHHHEATVIPPRTQSSADALKKAFEIDDDDGDTDTDTDSDSFGSEVMIVKSR